MDQPVQLKTDASSLDKKILKGLLNRRVASRLGSSDSSLWGNEAQKDAQIRLGWIDAVSRIDHVIETAKQLALELNEVNFSQIILCGMGGSSLAPQVICQNSPIPLVAVDSTHPQVVNELLSEERLLKSIIIVSTKSGETVETLSQLALCETRYSALGVNPNKRIIVITDPGSDLETYAQKRGYRVVLGNPDVGGRYSALTPFGLVPAYLAGVKLDNYAQDAQRCLNMIIEDSQTNPALLAATVLATSNQKLTTAQFSATGSLQVLPLWIEQLIAESTGKRGQGLLPLPRVETQLNSTGGSIVLLSESLESSRNCKDAMVVTASLPAQFVFWEFVTAILCEILDINPFNQPDVERTKVAARDLLADAAGMPKAKDIGEGLHLCCGFSDASVDSVEILCDQLLSYGKDANYLSVQVFSTHHSEVYTNIGYELERLTQRPVALSYGPQYLHSTGQLHKGGPLGAVFFQIIELPNSDVEVPQVSTTFGELLISSAIADMCVLKEIGQVGATISTDQTESLFRLLEELRSR